MQHAQIQQSLGLQLSERQEKARVNPTPQGPVSSHSGVDASTNTNQDDSNLLELRAATTADMNANRVPWASVK
jgi:hypothetical protein